jgi:hypothetical protein
MTALLAVDIPNPVNVVTDFISTPVGWAWDKVAEGIANWVLGAVAYFVEGVVNFLLTSARPDVESAWFAGPDSPYANVRNIAGVLLLAFVLLGLIQGLLAGDIAGMIRRVAADLPMAVLGMIGTTVIVAKLLELTDALSAAVLSNSDGQAVDFLSGFGVTVTGATQGFAAVLLGLVAVIAGMFLWIELMVRSVLVYILVALSPLSFAAMIWPSARGVLRRTIELLLAVILSKLVVCIAISVGVAALAGAGSAGGPDAGVGDQAATSLGTLFVGTAILAMAAFAPFLLLKLIPWAEAALVAQGVSRAPVHGARSTMGTVYAVNSVSRLAGGSSAIGASASAPPTTGWISGAPLAGSGWAAAAAGPIGVAAAGAAVATSATANAATRAVRESTDAATQPVAKEPPRANAPKRPQHRRLDAPPPGEEREE